MPYSFSFDPIAAAEHEEAYLWYLERSEKAAENLTKAIETAIGKICSDPFLYRNTYRNLREIPVKIYPYNLIYLIDEPNEPNDNC